MNHMRVILAAAVAVTVGAMGLEASAQIGDTVAAPVPDGLKPGTGAPFPKGHYRDLDSLPDWGGAWFATFNRPVPGQPPPPRPAPPALKGDYKARYDAWRARIAANHGVDKDAGSHCTGPGMPGIMGLPQYPYEFLFTPGRVTINQEAWMQTRHIWTDGRVHPQDPEPGFFGHSIGHWEGDTLVADTIAIKDTVPLGMGMSHSDKLHISERFHLKAGDPNTLLDEMTIEDPDALERPYTTTNVYHRDRYGELLEFECAENDRNPVDQQGNTEFKQ
jgi:hypothetical protein